MIKRSVLIALAALMVVFSVEAESWGHGFGGFHRRRGFVGRRGVGYLGVVGWPRRVGYGYGYGNVGNPYGPYGGVTTVGGIRVGPRPAPAPTAANLALADMAFARANNRPAPTGPAPGPGPIGIDSMSVNKSDKVYNSRRAALNAMREGLGQQPLPSDVGVPTPAPDKDKDETEKDDEK